MENTEVTVVHDEPNEEAEEISDLTLGITLGDLSGRVNDLEQWRSAHEYDHAPKATVITEEIGEAEEAAEEAEATAEQAEAVAEVAADIAVVAAEVAVEAEQTAEEAEAVADEPVTEVVVTDEQPEEEAAEEAAEEAEIAAEVAEEAAEEAAEHASAVRRKRRPYGRR